MIFVTVGTHEQPFNRLIEYIDNLKKNNLLEDKVIIQSGFSSYEPQYCTWSKLLPYSSILQNIEEARIVITHGGPASFILPLQVGKVPIVVPRQYVFGEHVNNHQVTFVRNVSTRMKNIIPIYDINSLGCTIQKYNKIVAEMNCYIHSNNKQFCTEFEKIVNETLMRD